MLKRGEIVVERLTGRRAIIIHVLGTEEVTCRFGDGRLEDRFIFELETIPSPLGALVTFLAAPFVSRPRDNPPTMASARVRPLIVRQPG